MLLSSVLSNHKLTPGYWYVYCKTSTQIFYTYKGSSKQVSSIITPQRGRTLHCAWLTGILMSVNKSKLSTSTSSVLMSFII